MSDRVQDLLTEAILSPHRDRDREGRPIPPPEWWDLPPEAQDKVFQEALAARVLERGVDARGRSGTVRAVLAGLGLA